MARGDCNITNICIPTRRIIYAAGFTPDPPPPGCNYPEGNFSQGGQICDWEYRVRYDIDSTKVPSEESNFPLMVFFDEIATDLSPGDAAIFWNEISRASIRVTSVNGSTELPHYTHALDNVNETGYMTVRVPVVAAGVTTSIFIYFANPAATEYAVGNPLGRNATFQDFAVVLDFEQDPAGAPPQLTDLTGNGWDGTAQGAWVSGDRVPGKIGSQWNFGAGDYVSLGGVPITGGAARTYLAWVDGVGGTSGVSSAIFSTGGVGTAERWELVQDGPPRQLRFEIQGTGQTTGLVNPGGNNLMHIRQSGTNFNTSVVGINTSLFNCTSSATINTGVTDTYIGNSLVVPRTWIHGQSLVAYALGAFSDNRMTTIFNNQNAPATFATFTNFLANT